MPFLQQDEEELKKQQGPQSLTGQSTVINSPMEPQKSGSPASSGQFKNLQTYLDANKEQGQAMGQNVIGSIDQTAQGALEKQSAFANEKPQSVSTKSANDLENEFYNNPNAKKEDYSALKNTGGYSGPASYNDMTSYQDAANATNEASRKLNMLGSQSGVESAVGEQFARPNYNQGAKRLDATLIRREPNIKSIAEDTRSKFSNISSLLDSTKNDMQSQIDSNLQAANLNRQLVPNAENEYLNRLQNTYNTRAEEQNAANQKNIDAIRADLSDNLLNEESLRKSGLNLGQNIYDLNLQDFLKTDNTQLQAKDVLTSDERNSWSNLMGLLDKENLYKSGLDVTPTSIDKEALNSALASAASTYEPQLQALLNKDYGVSGSGWLGTDNGTFKDLLNKYYDPMGHINPGTGDSALGKALATGDTSQLGPNGLQQYNDLQFWLKYNKQLGMEGANVINAPAGSGLTRPITGSLKG